MAERWVVDATGGAPRLLLRDGWRTVQIGPAWPMPGAEAEAQAAREANIRNRALAARETAP